MLEVATLYLFFKIHGYGKPGYGKPYFENIGIDRFKPCGVIFISHLVEQVRDVSS